MYRSDDYQGSAAHPENRVHVGGDRHLVEISLNHRRAFVDVDDVADVAVSALTDPRHAGQIYDLTGPRLLSFGEAVQEIARASERAVHYTPISNAAYAEALTTQLPPEQATLLSELFALLLDGHNSLLSDGVERALGRKARDFRDYARDAALAGAWRG